MNEQIILNHLSQNVSVKNKSKTILTDINLKINSKEFIAIVGCSGAGKTTLMNILGCYTYPSSGNILIDGYDMHENEEYFKGKIAYVPQQEILDKTLTLYKSLQYSLELRVKDLKKSQKSKIINNVLNTLELSHVKNVLIKNLSGGEKKRAAIATEMLNDPSIFLLDEPTSGLDANIEKKVMKKLRSIADSGKTIIISAHTISNLDLCDKIIFMGKDGKICYYGPFSEANKYFGVKEFVDIYDLLKEDTNKWHKLFCKNNRPDNVIKKNEQLTIKEKKQPSFLKQIPILVKRYISSLLNNKLMLILFLGQPILMGSLICCAIKKDSLLDPRFSAMICAAYSLAALWLGLFNTIQEIVKEKDILKKEYMSGLNYASYILSKIIIFSILCLYQAITCVALVYFYLDPMPDEALLIHPFIDTVIHFFLIAFSSSIIGLFISTIVKETKTTLILSPLYMMIQLIFSGMFLPFIGITKNVSYFVFGRWAYEGFGTIFNLTKYGVIEFNKGSFKFTTGHLISMWMVIFFASLFILLLSIISIKYFVLSKRNKILVLDENKNKIKERRSISILSRSGC